MDGFDKKDSTWPLVGNGHIIKFLEGSMKNGNVAGTYVFSGPDGLGKTTTALHFAKSMLCQNRGYDAAPCGRCPVCFSFARGEDVSYSDFLIIRREKDKKNIGIEQVREFINFFSMSSFLDSYKIGIIKEADSLSIESANALLKTLEEPRKDVVLILITSDADSLPKTILSRSKLLYFSPVKTDDIFRFLVERHHASRQQAEHCSHLSAGRPALALKFLEERDYLEDYLTRAKTFLDFFEIAIGERLASLGKIMDQKLAGQEAVASALQTLEVWQSLVRDFFLMDSNNNDKIRHKSIEAELRVARTSLSSQRAVEVIDIIRLAEKRIAANVNPRAVLEGVAMTI